MDWSCCWTRESISPGECPYVQEGESELLQSLRRRLVEKCSECFRFRDDLQKLKQEGHPVSLILPYLLEEFNEQKAQIQAMAGFLDTKKREIRFLHELWVVLQTSVELDEVLSVAMTAITAGKGFGMNRALLLLVDRESGLLKGHLGVGPRNFDEAWRTWEDINRHNFSLKEMARNFYDTKLQPEKMKFSDILERLSVPLDRHDHVLNTVLRDRKPLLVDQQTQPRDDNGISEILAIPSYLIMPLISRSRRIGIIIADNCVTHKPITPVDMQSMETFAFAVAFAIERAALYEQLQEKVDKLTQANIRLKEQQELMLRMEKMALVGKITSGIAHSIRNPLMVIGGFARTLMKNAKESDPNREFLQSIVREARQLDDVLEEVLTYSDSLYPAVDMWDVNHLATRVYQEFTERLEKNRLTGALDLAPDLPTVFIDFRQISFCLRNLVTAVIEMVQEAGTIRIQTSLRDDAVLLELHASPYRNGIQGGVASAYAPTDSDSALGICLCRNILEKEGIPFAIRNHAEELTYQMLLPLERRNDDAEAARS